MRTITFTINHEPVAEGRARAYRVGGYIRLVTPEKTRHYKALVAELAAAAVGDAEPLVGAMAARISVFLPIPASLSKKARTALQARFATRKPDVDNLAKSIMDGCNGIVYLDDSQVVRLTIEKRYLDEPMTVVEFTEIVD